MEPFLQWPLKSFRSDSSTMLLVTTEASKTTEVWYFSEHCERFLPEVVFFLTSATDDIMFSYLLQAEHIHRNKSLSDCFKSQMFLSKISPKKSFGNSECWLFFLFFSLFLLLLCCFFFYTSKRTHVFHQRLKLKVSSVPASLEACEFEPHVVSKLSWRNLYISKFYVSHWHEKKRTDYHIVCWLHHQLLFLGRGCFLTHLGYHWTSHIYTY